VFLHEGLGSVSMWRDFPDRLADATAHGALVYSRAGHGKSDPAPLPRTLSFMNEEAVVLGEVLERTGVREAVLVGQSDGASIALIHAAGASPANLRALVLEAPHVFCEDVTVKTARLAAQSFRSGELRSALERHHGANVDGVFAGWSGVWLDPGFRTWSITDLLPRIQVPVLVIQGEQDPYGTLRQVEAIAHGCSGHVEQLLLADCGHAPHRERAERTLEAMVDFVQRHASPQRSRDTE
jgi:pimeloyl-ACP methyl ester carboxylesterase